MGMDRNLIERRGEGISSYEKIKKKLGDRPLKFFFLKIFKNFLSVNSGSPIETAKWGGF